MDEVRESQSVNISMQKEGYKSVKELLVYNQNKASIREWKCKQISVEDKRL